MSEQHGEDGADGPRTDVRSVLEEIGAEGALADLEARVEDLERDLQRADDRAREAEEGRQGERELMRARMDEALELLRTSMEEQRLAFQRFEERFAGMVDGAADAARTYVDELRDELTPRVQLTVVRTEELAAELRGELRVLADDTQGRDAATAEAAEETRAELGDRIAELERSRTEYRQASEAATADRMRIFDERLGAVEVSSRSRHDEQRAEVEALRRELDAAVGELRAGLNLRSGELVERIEDARLDLTERLEDQQAVARGLEERWVEGTREIAQRVEQVVGIVRQSTSGERAARETAHDELAGRVEELARTVGDLRDRFAAEATRHSAELEAVRMSADELGSRLAAVEGKVADTVGSVASQLTNRVAELAGNLEALMSTSVRHEERLAGIERLERQLAELAAGQAELATGRSGPDREQLGELIDRLTDLRQREKGTAERLDVLHQQLRELGERVADVAESAGRGESLRHEVRELAARSSELTHRLDETERVARAAGQAITRAVRLARQPAGTSDAPAARPQQLERAARRLEESADELQALDATDVDPSTRS